MGPIWQAQLGESLVLSYPPLLPLLTPFLPLPLALSLLSLLPLSLILLLFYPLVLLPRPPLLILGLLGQLFHVHVCRGEGGASCLRGMLSHDSFSEMFELYGVVMLIDSAYVTSGCVVDIFEVNI